MRTLTLGFVAALALAGCAKHPGTNAASSAKMDCCAGKDPKAMAACKDEKKDASGKDACDMKGEHKEAHKDGKDCCATTASAAPVAPAAAPAATPATK